VLEAGSSLKAGTDFHLAFSPEREDPGNPQSVVATIPKVAFYPGPGLGGHCIPIDPFYLTWKAREYG
jgi:UDP-N-acetyl-D-mannosaminuronate dehydrogenase